MKNNTIRRVLGGLAIAVLSSSLANASSISWWNRIFTAPDSPTSASSSPVGAPTQYASPFSATVSIPTFDASTGNPQTYNQLTSIQIVMAWVSSGQVNVFNFDQASAHNFTAASSSVPLSITGPDGTVVNTTAVTGPSGGGSVAAAPPCGFALCASETTVSGLTGSGTANNTVIGNGLNSYYGNGVTTLSFNFTSGNSSYTGTEVGGSGHLAFSGNALDGAGIEVTYNYDTLTIPEPGSFVMLGSALLGLGLVIRKRSSKA
jgi:hypothetical protein